MKPSTHKEVTVTELEMHEPQTAFVGKNDSRERIFAIRSPHYVMMKLANERAGVTDNLVVEHGYKHYYLPEKREHHFIKYA